MLSLLASLDKGGLQPVARSDIVPCDTLLIGPFENGVLLSVRHAIVDDNHLPPAAKSATEIQNPLHANARVRDVSPTDTPFATAIIDVRQGRGNSGGR
jgi:hypothetical protein